MSVFFNDTFSGVASGQYSVLEGWSPDSVTYWERLLTGSWPNQNLINSSGRVFRSAYNPVFGPECLNGSEHYLTIEALPADYIIEAVVRWSGEFLTTGGPALDEPDGSSRSINASGYNNNGEDVNESHFRIQGRWTQAYKGYQLSYRASTQEWKLSVCKGDVPQSERIVSQFAGGVHPMRFATTNEYGFYSTAPGLRGKDLQANYDTGVVVEYVSGLDAPTVDGGGSDPPDNGEFDWFEGGTIIAKKVYSIPLNGEVTCQLRMRGNIIEGRVIVGSEVTVIGVAIDETFTGVRGTEEDNMVGLRFDGGSSPVKGVQCSSFKVHNDFTSGGGDPYDGLEAPVIAVEMSTNVATISWDAVEDATYYTVFTGDACGDTMTELAAHVTSTSYVTTALLEGKHAFMVVAHNATYVSDPSNCVEVVVSVYGVTPAGESPNRPIRFYQIYLATGDTLEICRKCKQFVPRSRTKRHKGAIYCYDHVPIERRGGAR